MLAFNLERQFESLILIRRAWNNGYIGNVGFGYFNFKRKYTLNVGNVRNISNIDFLIVKPKGHIIRVILGILVMLALDILI
jgi:hypothetical protein